MAAGLAARITCACCGVGEFHAVELWTQVTGTQGHCGSGTRCMQSLHAVKWCRCAAAERCVSSGGRWWAQVMGLARALWAAGFALCN